MVIGEEAASHNDRIAVLQRGGEFLGPSDAGKGEHRFACKSFAIGLQTGAQQRTFIFAQIGRTVANQNDGIGAGQALRHRLAQRARRNLIAVAETGFRIHHDQRQVLGDRKILMAVIHDDDGGAFFFRQPRPGGTVARHDGGGGARQQQGFIAHHRGAVAARSQSRAAFAATITAGEEIGFVTACAQHLGKGDGDGSLAAAAGGEIADTDHGQSRVEAFGDARLERNSGAIQPAQRRQQRRRRAPSLPEIRRAHRASSPALPRCAPPRRTGWPRRAPPHHPPPSPWRNFPGAVWLRARCRRCW